MEVGAESGRGRGLVRESVRLLGLGGSVPVSSQSAMGWRWLEGVGQVFKGSTTKVVAVLTLTPILGAPPRWGLYPVPPPPDGRPEVKKVEKRF